MGWLTPPRSGLPAGQYRDVVAEFWPVRRQFDHPRAGLLTLDYVKLAAAKTPEVKLIALVPADAMTTGKLPALVKAEARRDGGLPA